MVRQMKLELDDVHITIIHSRFEYRPDPVIISVSPLTSFESGGRELIVMVRDFHIDIKLSTG